FFDTDDVINAVNILVQVLIANYGRVGTLLIFAALIVLSGLWRYISWRRKDKQIDLALTEKDRTIQRLAESERNFRILFFKQQGMTAEEIERFVMRNEFPDVPTARRQLEGEEASPKQPAPKKRRG